jgi:mannose-6-phosphate isomerase
MTIMTSKEPQLEPFRLAVRFVERVWGSLDLSPWYSHSSAKPVGEAWLTGETCIVETGPHAGKLLAQMEEEFHAPLLGDLHDRFPLLLKFLFPQDKLSVQVHPDDELAAELGDGARAKTECWYILAAEPGTTVSLGLTPGTTDEMVREALGNKALEELLHNEPVEAGDMVYVEAGTVHAIGAGVVILEVQQPSDTTFRLYDYGRDRELHLEDGMRVLKIDTDAGKIVPEIKELCTELIHVKHFALTRCDATAGESYSFRTDGTPECVVALAGSGVVGHGKSRVDLPVGQAVVIPACCQGYSVEGECSFVRCRVPKAA